MPPMFDTSHLNHIRRYYFANPPFITTIMRAAIYAIILGAAATLAAPVSISTQCYPGRSCQIVNAAGITIRGRCEYISLEIDGPAAVCTHLLHRT